jgi:hypothetical protein
MTDILFLVKKFPGEKGSVTVHYHDATACSFVFKVKGEVFTNFYTVIIKHHSNMWNCLTCQDELL